MLPIETTLKWCVRQQLNCKLFFFFFRSSRPGRPPKRTQSVTSPENSHIMPHSVPGLLSPGIIPPTGRNPVTWTGKSSTHVALGTSEGNLLKTVDLQVEGCNSSTILYSGASSKWECVLACWYDRLGCNTWPRNAGFATSWIELLIFSYQSAVVHPARKTRPKKSTSEKGQSSFDWDWP